MMWYALYAVIFLMLCVAGGNRAKGSVYLHILGLTIPLIIRTAPPVLTLDQKRKRGVCCDRYKRTKTNHSPACRKRAITGGNLAGL